MSITARRSALAGLAAVLLWAVLPSGAGASAQRGAAYGWTPVGTVDPQTVDPQHVISADTHSPRGRRRACAAAIRRPPGADRGGVHRSPAPVTSVALAAVSAVLRVRLPHRCDLPLIAVCAFTGMSAYPLLLNWGEVHVPAGTASLLIATAPVFSVLLASIFLG
ncbi:DMT family transporter [Nonomuraea composti]|uniref:DMT family transporter n=1 Tax=Nonomuraea composti TaxID=2720023 RepID=UPI00198068BC|nr:DMT family transporter [Nonomuraea sp. FMUSA5-5]